MMAEGSEARPDFGANGNATASLPSHIREILGFRSPSAPPVPFDTIAHFEVRYPNDPRMDPEYAKFYYSHPNPRLPRPILPPPDAPVGATPAAPAAIVATANPPARTFPASEEDPWNGPVGEIAQNALAKRPSLVDLIQEDFPCTPSPIYDRGTGPPPPGAAAAAAQTATAAAVPDEEAKFTTTLFAVSGSAGMPSPSTALRSPSRRQVTSAVVTSPPPSKPPAQISPSARSAPEDNAGDSEFAEQEAAYRATMDGMDRLAVRDRYAQDDPPENLPSGYSASQIPGALYGSPQPHSYGKHRHAGGGRQFAYASGGGEGGGHEMARAMLFYPSPSSGGYPHPGQPTPVSVDGQPFLLLPAPHLAGASGLDEASGIMGTVDTLISSGGGTFVSQHGSSSPPSARSA